MLLTEVRILVHRCRRLDRWIPAFAMELIHRYGNDQRGKVRLCVFTCVFTCVFMSVFGCVCEKESVDGK